MSPGTPFGVFTWNYLLYTVGHQVALLCFIIVRLQVTYSQFSFFKWVNPYCSTRHSQNAKSVVPRNTSAHIAFARVLPLAGQQWPSV